MWSEPEENRSPKFRSNHSPHSSSMGIFGTNFPMSLKRDKFWNVLNCLHFFDRLFLNNTNKYKILYLERFVQNIFHKGFIEKFILKLQVALECCKFFRPPCHSSALLQVTWSPPQTGPKEGDLLAIRWSFIKVWPYLFHSFSFFINFLFG